MDLNSKFRLSEKVIIEGFGNESVMLDLKSGKFFKLNLTAQKIISLLRSEMTLDEIAQTLSDKNLTEVREDIIFFLNDLVKRGFIEILNKDF